MQEFQSLKDTMSMQKSQITEEIGHLKMVMKKQKAQIVEEITVKIETNKVKISQIINENVNLHKENIALQERVSKLESAQLTNNIIISGILEQPFKTYEKTKQRIYDTFASAIGSADPSMALKVLEEAMKVVIEYCMRIGKQKLGYNRNISITLSRCDDKERIIGIKSKLPQEIYITMNTPYM